MFNEWKIPLNIWTHFLPSTSHPILRRSHHRSRHCNAPAPPMLIILIFVSSPTRAWRTATATRLCIGRSLTDIAKRKKHGAVDDLVAVSRQTYIARLVYGFRNSSFSIDDTYYCRPAVVGILNIIKFRYCKIR